MLKKRLIAVLTIQNRWVVQSILFSNYLPVGRIETAVEALNRWGIDEIVLLDIQATKDNRPPDFDILKKAAACAFVPLTFGGGLRRLEEMHQAIRLGADKIVLNSAAIRDPGLIEKAARTFGSQCVVVSVDVQPNAENAAEVFLEGGRKPAGLGVESWVREAENRGAGEIFLTAIHRDGTKRGFDVDLIRRTCEKTHLPVIGCGGAGHPAHFLEAFATTDVSALAAGNYFHFTEQSPVVTKSFLEQNGVKIRLDSDAAYQGAAFDADGRIAKWPEQYLKELRYRVIHEDVI